MALGYTSPPSARVRLETPASNKKGTKRHGLNISDSPTENDQSSATKKRRVAPFNMLPQSASLSLKEHWQKETAAKLLQEAEERREKLVRENAYNATYASFGVHVVDMPPAIENKAKVAGYLNQLDTASIQILWTFHKSTLDECFLAAGQDYDIAPDIMNKVRRTKGNADRNFYPAVFFETLRDGWIEVEDIQGTGELDKVKFPIDDHSNGLRMYAYVARCVYKILEAHSGGLPEELGKEGLREVFTGQYKDNGDDGEVPTNPSKLLGHDPEDIYRAYMLYRSLVSARRKSTYTDELNIPRLNRGLPILPLFAPPSASRAYNPAKLASQQCTLGQTDPPNISEPFVEGEQQRVPVPAGMIMEPEASRGGDSDSAAASQESIGLLAQNSTTVRRSTDSPESEPEPAPGQVIEVVKRLASDIQVLFASPEEKDSMLVDDDECSSLRSTQQVALELRSATQNIAGQRLGVSLERLVCHLVEYLAFRD